jgi:hypothetical protein
MTRNKKKENKAQDGTDLATKENVKDGATTKTPKPGAAKAVPVAYLPPKNNKSTVAPAENVGLLVTAELDKAIEECKAKVAQIVKGCRESNRKFRCFTILTDSDSLIT